MTQASQPPQDSDPSLTVLVARGAAWILGAGLVARLFGAINVIVVARLLAPEDIGIVATATIVMQLLQGFSDIGVSQAVVKFRDADRDDLNTLFTLSAIRGCLVGAILIIAAPFAAGFYGDERLFWAFMGIAPLPMLLGLINPRFFEFERDLMFSREFVVTILSRLFAVAVSLAIAIIFRTYWAIILGMLAGGAVQLLLSYILRPYLPRFCVKSFRKVFGFSSWLAGVSFMAALNNKLDVPILSRLVGAGGAGVYFFGLQLSELITGQIAAPLTRAIFPGLSQMQGDNARMRSAFLRGVEALGVFAMPAAFGLAFVARDFTLVVLGEKWGAAVPVIMILAPVIGMQSLFFASQSYAVALGLTRFVFFRELIFFLVRMPVFTWATLVHGLSGAITATAVMGVFHVALNLALYARTSGGQFWEPLWSARRAIGAVAAMAVWFIFVRPGIVSFDNMTPLARLSIDALLGALIYISALAGLWRVAGAPDGVERQIYMALIGLFKKVTARQ